VLICWQRKLRGQLEKIDLDLLFDVHAVSDTFEITMVLHRSQLPARTNIATWVGGRVLRLLDESLLTAASLFGHLV
jgi:hypothetical protein